LRENLQPTYPTSSSDLSSLATELLLVRAKQGNSLAWDRLFVRVRKRLLGAIRNHPSHALLPDDQSEVDLFQELWTTLIARASFDHFEDRGPGSLRAFLHRCLDYLIKDSIKSARAAKRGGERRRLSLDGDGLLGGEPDSPVTPGPGPATAAEWRDWESRCLEILKGQNREVWRLRFVEDLDYPTIAEHLGKSESSIRSAYDRALDELYEAGVLELERSA